MKNRHTTIVSTEVLRQSGAPGSLHVFELSNEQAKDSQLVVLVEIEISDKDNEIIIEDMVREIEQQFFNSPAKETEYAFENALAKANIKVKDILLAKPKNWLNRIHVAVLAIADSEVHMASVGMVHAFLVHSGKIVDVLKAPNGPAAPNPVKLFTNIVSGTLAPDTSMVLVNESVLDYLSVERIRKCAQELDAPEALAALTELLGRAPSHKQFGLAVVSRQEQRALSKTPATDMPEPQKTLSRPGIYAEEEYETVPAYRSEPGRADERMAPRTTAAAKSIALAIAKKSVHYGHIALEFALAALAKSLEALQRAVRRGVPAAVGISKTVFASLKSQDTRAYIITRIKYRGTQFIHGQSRTRQAAGLAIIALILVFAGSIAVRGHRQNQEERALAFESSMASIGQKMSEAEASLIYGNKIKSQALLAEIQTLLTNLSLEFPNQEERYSQIRASITELQNKGEQKQTITDIEIAATIIPAPLSPNQTGLVSLGAQGIFFYDGVAEKIASLDTQNQLLLSLPLANQGIASFHAALGLEGSELAAFTEGKVLIVDTDDETVTAQEFSYAPADVQPFASYNGNIYTFSPDENRIMRYRRAGAGFTAAQNWLSQDYELATMRDIAVDGSIYLLDSQGTIHTFLNGKINNTIPWGAQELPGEYTRLYTSGTSDVFYVLDPVHSRVVVINKQGDLLIQLVNPVLANATDLVVDPNEKNLYTLSGDTIHRLGIPNY